MTTAEKIAAIEASELCLAFDGCHKIYLLETPEHIADAASCGYEIRPASTIRATIASSCGLVFVQRWGLGDGRFDSDWTIPQGTENIYTAAEESMTL